MVEAFHKARESFDLNIKSVDDLIDFDRFVVDHMVGGLDDLAETLGRQGQNNAARTVSNRVMALKTVRVTDSLRPRYRAIFNQCVVLLVSYCDSVVHDVFRVAAAYALRRGLRVPLAGTETGYHLARLIHGRVKH